MTTTTTRQSPAARREPIWTDCDGAAYLAPLCVAGAGPQLSERAMLDPDRLPGRGRWGLD